MKILGLFGVLLILLGEMLSFVHLLPWSRYVFPLCWYGYIFALDSINYHVQGRSLISDRFKEFLFMLPVSAAYWYLFEGYNEIIHNWFYINTPAEKWVEIPMKILSFATVVPALFETADLVSALAGKTTELGEHSGLRIEWHYSLIVLGVVLCLLPFLVPRLFFWSVWVGPFLVLDTVNDRLGRASFLREWRAGAWRRTVIWLFAGYIAGFFWEFWNYWAFTKWIYSVPLPEMPHIFEMPILGFLGFGPFALETFAFWTLVWRKDLS
jgi:hypothetical protein